MAAEHAHSVDKGERFPLSIKGYTISTLILSQHNLPTLMFSYLEKPEAKIDLEAVVLTIARGAEEYTLHWDQTPYAPSQLVPIVELIGCTVKEAFAYKNGVLYLELSQDFSMRAVPDLWEGWHFSHDGKTLHGDDGRLI